MPVTSIGRYNNNKLTTKQLFKSMKNCRKHKRLKSAINLKKIVVNFKASKSLKAYKETNNNYKFNDQPIKNRH